MPELRVHGGELGGRRLKTLRGIRPTQGLVKEAIFNSLGELVVDAVVLDLFAGSGALGIEALSRGASAATFVERHDETAAILRQNLEALGLTGRSRIVRSEVVRWLEAHAGEIAEAGLVLLDPPYGDTAFEGSLARLDAAAAEGTTVVAEHARRQALPPLTRLAVTRAKDYGDTTVTVLRA